MTEHIGILGTGTMGGALAHALSQAGYSVLLGSRTLDRARQRAAELTADVPIQPADYATAVSAPVIILALGFSDALALLPTLGSALADKIIVDVSTPWDNEIAERSAAERLAEHLPASARLVGAWKTTFAELLDGSISVDTQHDVFVSGNNPAAKQAISAIITRTGFRAIDCGDLPTARVIESMVRLMGPLFRATEAPGATAPPAWKFLP